MAGRLMVDQSAISPPAAPWVGVRRRIADLPTLEIILPATLLSTVFPAGSQLHWATGALALFGMLRAGIRGSAWLWFGITAVRVADHLWYGWYRVDNHHFLLTYWCLALGLVLLSNEPLQTLRINARLLIGLCFAFACSWKLAGGEYVNGSFFAFLLLATARTASWIPWLDIPSKVIEGNAAALAAAGASPDTAEMVLLAGATPSLWASSVAMGAWTIVIELVVAVTFLVPLPRSWARLRDIALLGFVASTYLMAPVLTFALVLLVMGYAQLEEGQAGWRRAYLAVFVLLIPVVYSIYGQPYRGLMLAGAVLMIGYLLKLGRWLLGGGLLAASVGAGLQSSVLANSVAAAALSVGTGVVVLALLDLTLRRRTEPFFFGTGAVALVVALAAERFDSLVAGLWALGVVAALVVTVVAQARLRRSRRHIQPPETR